MKLILMLAAWMTCAYFLPINVLAAESASVGGDFTLTDHQGKPFSLQQQRDKVVIMFFGFTHCPMVCPTSMTNMKSALARLGDRADQVQALFITVDPERDTVEHLAKYIKAYDADITALTGSSEAISQVTKQYRIQVDLNKKSADDKDYLVDHTADFYVLDRQGQVKTVIPYGLPAEHLYNVVDAVLAERDVDSIVKGITKPDVEMDHSKMDHGDMDHSKMDHGDMDHSKMDHGDMDHSKMDHGDMDHSKMDHGDMDHSKMDHDAKKTPEPTAPTLTDSQWVHPFMDLKGTTQTLKQWQGKPLLINFWASWCPPCREELPSLNRLWETQTSSGVQMLAINVGEKPAAVEAFLKDYPIDFPVWLDQGDSGEVLKQWSLKGLPSTLLIDKHGVLQFNIAGEREWDSTELRQRIESALAD